MATIECWVPNTSCTKSLNKKDARNASLELNKRALNFPRLNRRYIDPQISGQNYYLTTWIPAKGATPNEKGFYGYIKHRGTFNTVEECKIKADELIRDVDSTNSIFTCRVGHPVPAVVTGFAKELTEVDLVKAVEQDVSNNIRSKAAEDKKIAEEIRERERKLKTDVEQEPDPQDEYIAKRTKLATLRFTIGEHDRLKAECIEFRDACIVTLNEMFRSNPEYETNFLHKYMEARRDAHIPESTDLEGFMKFINYPINEDDNTTLDITNRNATIPDIINHATIPTDTIPTDTIPDIITHDTIPDITNNTIPHDAIPDITNQSTISTDTISDITTHDTIPDDITNQTTIPDDITNQATISTDTISDITTHDTIPDDITTHDTIPDDITIHDTIPIVEV